MNKSDLDNLFRDKLGHHEMSPTPEAWGKLKGNLEGDRKKGLLIYWRVAAIIVFMIGSMVLLFKFQNSNTEMVANKQDSPSLSTDISTNNDISIADNNVIKEEIGDSPVAMPQKEIAAVNNTPKATVDQPSQVSKEVKNRDQVKKKAKSPAQKTVQPSPVDQKTLVAATETPVEDTDAKTLIAVVTEAESHDQIKNQETNQPDEIGNSDETLTAISEKMANADASIHESVAIQDVQPKNITITFKKDNNAIPVTEKKLSKNKKFGLKAVIGLAKDIKNAELGISNLRAKKDQLLAKNFSKKKNVKISK